jgi:adenosine kinase
MTFPGKFTDQLIADKLDKVSLSFLVDELSIRRGGVAANIAFGLGVLGLRPLLIGGVGADFAECRGTPRASSAPPMPTATRSARSTPAR